MLHSISGFVLLLRFSLLHESTERSSLAVAISIQNRGTVLRTNFHPSNGAVAETVFGIATTLLQKLRTGVTPVRSLTLCRFCCSRSQAENAKNSLLRTFALRRPWLDDCWMSTTELRRSSSAQGLSCQQTHFLTREARFSRW